MPVTPDDKVPPAFRISVSPGSSTDMSVTLRVPDSSFGPVVHVAVAGSR